ncbi:TLP183/Psb32/MOLO-1 phosphatase superfamily protein [Georgenia soli]|uniref:TLP183/Psb32/MOLO-1 phosphatase superfamily protein n=1 Tax=Georgenia soli TaxID=638953 RepID=A0A2A9EJN6_9MICO|nr:TPM domain-containing protein [Georgenia soli]PFG39154.1 TLP183/Psb32/MOLO-1 phosphatase superfamily protein [Georgenia soli]
MRLVAVVRSLAAAALVTASAVAIAGPAAAEPPTNLADQVTDTADVLSDSDVAEIQAAFDKVQNDTGQMVFVAFVDNFDGMSAKQWSVDTAKQSNLGPDNVLLSVAVGEGAYGYGLHSDSPVSDAEVQQIIREDVVPALRSEDWTQASIAFAQGVGDAAQGGLSGSGGAGMGGGMGGFLTIALIGLVVIGGIGLISVFRRRKGGEAQPRQARQQLPPDHPLNLPTPELAKRAGTALLGADDAVRSSEEELGFAKAQFGLQATDQFSAALEEAKRKAQRAFALRQQLDDDVPETEPQQRQMYAEILQLTSEIDQTLSAQAEHFVKLRDMQARAPQVLSELDQRATEVERQIEGARAQLAQLRTQYPDTALASVLKNPDHAKALLVSAHESVATGRAKVEAGDRQTAVTHARVAEEAIAQASTLLGAVNGAGAALADAGNRLDAALASITRDVQDANRLAPNDPAVIARRKEAEAAIAQGHHARTGGDPLAALQRLHSAETAIDAVLAPARDADENRRRASAQLQDRLGRLNSQIRAVSDYISTRRGTVGTEARTRLSEAARLASEANHLSTTDPVAAMQKVAQAEQMAADAQRLAERDSDRYDPWGGGGWGGGYGGGRRGGIDVGSLILGGILLGGGGHGGGWGGGGGFGGGGFGGGGGGFGGGGFGGGGGRF